MREVPVAEKFALSVEEAAAYTGIGMGKIRELMSENDCDFVLRVGRKKSLIKRKCFEKYLMQHEAI